MANVKKRGIVVKSVTNKASASIKTKPEKPETKKLQEIKDQELKERARRVWMKVCPLPPEDIPSRVSPTMTKKVFDDLVKACGTASKSDIALLESSGWTLTSLMGRCSIYSAIAGVRGIALIIGPRPREVLEYETVSLEDIWKLRTSQ